MVRVVCLVSFLVFATAIINCSGARSPQEEGGTPDSSVTDQSGGDSGTTDQPAADTPGTTGTFAINEIAAKGQPNDWFELVNTGSTPIDLSTYTFSDDPSDPKKGVFKPGTVLQPGEYKAFFFDDTWPGFGLGKEDRLAIYDASGKVIDEVEWKDGDSPDGKSYGRLPNGVGKWQTLAQPTPGDANTDAPAPEPQPEPTTEPQPEPAPDASTDQAPTPDEMTPEPSQDTPTTQGKLVINELAAAGDPDDWFELYNGTGKDIDLSDYSVADDLKDDKTRVKFPKGTIIKAGEAMLFTLTKSWPDFKLGGDEELGLYDPKGDLVDSVDWNEGDSPADKSYGRSPNGTGTFKTFDKPSPGKTNP